MSFVTTIIIIIVIDLIVEHKKTPLHTQKSFMEGFRKRQFYQYHILSFANRQEDLPQIFSSGPKLKNLKQVLKRIILKSEEIIYNENAFLFTV